MIMGLTKSTYASNSDIYVGFELPNRYNLHTMWKCVCHQFHWMDTLINSLKHIKTYSEKLI